MAVSAYTNGEGRPEPTGRTRPNGLMVVVLPVQTLRGEEGGNGTLGWGIGAGKCPASLSGAGHLCNPTVYS